MINKHIYIYMVTKTSDNGLCVHRQCNTSGSAYRLYKHVTYIPTTTTLHKALNEK